MSEIEEKVQKYKDLTEKAIGKVKFMKEISKKEQKIAKDFLRMAKNYFEDATHFQKKNELLTALAAFSYAHAWLDAGVRAGFFDVQGDDQLFTLP